MAVRGPGNWLRRTRKALPGSLTCLLLGAAGHVAAGGRLPGTAGLAGILAVLLVLFGVLSELRRHRFAATVLVMGALQSILHLVLHAAAGGHDAMAAHRSTSTGRPAHVHHAGHHTMPAPVPDTASEATSGHAMDPGMTVAHTFAALGTAACLVYGERVLERLANLLLHPLLRTAAPAAVPVPPERAQSAHGGDLPAPHGALIARVHPRRGPPTATYA